MDDTERFLRELTAAPARDQSAYTWETEAPGDLKVRKRHSAGGGLDISGGAHLHDGYPAVRLAGSQHLLNGHDAALSFFVVFLLCLATLALVLSSPDAQKAAERVIRSVFPAQQEHVRAAYFSAGSTTEEVLAAQGAPSSIEGRVWRYGRSEIRFDGARVVSWKSAPENPLYALQGASGR